MKENMVFIRNIVNKFLYKNIVRPILFYFEPEKVHDLFILIGQFIGSNFISRNITRLFFSYQNKSLEQNILGIKFKNPLGLAAGFDKDARIINSIDSTGFGFEEIGSVTGEKCLGNSKPRLWRIPSEKALVVYYGLKNQGAEEISKKLKNKKFGLPILVSIAKTNSPQTCNLDDGIRDYVKAYTLMQEIGDIFVINISCPNAYGGQPFHNADSLNKLLSSITKIKTKKPIFIKLSPEIDKKNLDNIIALALKYGVKGMICSNLSKNNKILDNKKFNGGLSGKPAEKLSNAQIKYVYRKSKGRLIIIGVGGIFSAKDAYEKIKLGASLVQLITGMIYEGPQLISEINQGLVQLLKEDGLDHISEAIGMANK